ncbi:hypothetical protein MTO96_008023 [Rhipicephalus appendiculatus]
MTTGVTLHLMDHSPPVSRLRLSEGYETHIGTLFTSMVIDEWCRFAGVSISPPTALALGGKARHGGGGMRRGGDVTFSWTFHPAHQTTPLSPNASFSTPPGAPLRSVLSYTPRSDADYGTLYCGARNAVGDNLEPCVFQIHPVGGLRVDLIFPTFRQNREATVVPPFLYDRLIEQC